MHSHCFYSLSRLFFCKKIFCVAGDIKLLLCLNYRLLEINEQKSSLIQNFDKAIFDFRITFGSSITLDRATLTAKYETWPERT